MCEITYSDHALERAEQRGRLSFEQIEFIIQHGHKCHNAGVTFRQLRRKDIPAQALCDDKFSKLEGSTVVLDRWEQVVITVYREEKAFNRDKKKQKYLKRWEQIGDQHSSVETAA